MRLSLCLSLGLLFFTCSITSFGKEARIVKGDYEASITENGLEVKYKGIPFICASHFCIHKPEWKGIYYISRNLPASKTAKIETTADRITITDTAAEIMAQITQEICIEESGLTISLRARVDKDIPKCPSEFPLAIFPAELFAGGRFRAAGLLGAQDWQTLPLEKPKETGPGTKSILSNIFGLELEGKGLLVSIECLQGPYPTFYDMRSREYPGAEKNFWLLYSWPISKGEMFVQARISARKSEAVAMQPQKGQIFITDGQKRVEVRAIVVDKSAHEIEKAAAKELQTYLVKMGGGEIPVIEADNQRPFLQGAIYVGKGRAAQDGFLFFNKFYEDREFDALGYDGFILRSRGGNVLAAGKNHLGTVYAVYRLLEKLGCRFYAKELEAVSAGAPVTIPGPFTESDSAAFEWRAMFGTIAPMKCYLSPGEWEAKVAGLDVPKMMAFPKGGFWHHTMGFLLPAKKLAESHPEYLALINGQRAVVEPAVQQYCLSNPGLLRAMTDAVLDWIASDPDKMYYPVHYGDVVKFCECENCNALYAEKGSITDAVIWFDNQIARAVAEKFPGKFVTILAYLSTRKAPVKVRPEPNLLIIFCAIVECQARPWSAPINMKKDVCKDLEDWARVHPLGAKGIISFDYPTTYHFAGYPYPALYAYVENIRYYHKIGLRGTYVCGLGGWKHLEHLYSYVMPRIMWKPEQDMGALIDQFCQAWYGKAWKPMREYVEMLHRSAMNSQSESVMDCHAGPGQKFCRELYTRDFLDKAYALFARAESLAEDDYVKRRIMKEKWGLLFVDLFLYAAKGGEIVPAPTELGVERKIASFEDYKKIAEFLRINRLFNRPWDMEPRRKFTLTSLTGIEPSVQPWWNCPLIKEIMDDPAAAHAKQTQIAQVFAKHFVTLENERLKAVIIPRLGGRIWRLYDKRTKQDLLWRGTVPLSVLTRSLNPDQYVNLGGYEEYTGEKFGSPGWAEAYECNAGPDGRSVTLVLNLPNKLRLTRTITLRPDGAGIEIDSTLENTSSQPVKEAILRAHPQFAYLGGQPELSLKAADGSSKPFAYKKGENFFSGKDLPVGAWTVRFPKLGLTIAHEFDPAQVATCLFYAGHEFFNMELFSTKKDLAGGERLRLKHAYIVK